MDSHEATRSAIEAVWRIESPRLIAGLARITGDVGVAEELAQDALVIALEQWPVRGVPDGPGAWLMATAKHRAIDLVRRRARYDQKLREIGRDMEAQAQAPGEPDVDKMDDHIGDERATRRPRGRTGSAPSCARRRCGSAVSSRASCHGRSRYTGSSR